MKNKTYPIKTVDTYVYLVKENLLLIRDLIDKKNNKVQPFDPNNTEPYYQARAKHLQSMALIGLTCEHLLKLIIQNRGYSINLVNNIKRTKNNKVKINYSDSLISFEALVSLFKKSNPENYYDNIKPYPLNDPKINYEYSYLGYKRIDPDTCVNLIQKIRNNYVHKADSNNETNGVIWYVFNFLVWLSKKEFNTYFDDIDYIGNKEIIDLFKND